MQHAPCGRHHHRRGKLFSCGRGSGGRLGLGAACEDVAVPARVTGELLHEEIMQADGGRAHSVAVTSSGAIYTWGTGDRGQLGHRVSGAHDDDDEVAWYPRRVTAGLPHLPVAFVSAGGDHSIAVFYGPVESTVSSADDDASDGRTVLRERSGSSSSYHRSRAGTSTSDSGASLVRRRLSELHALVGAGAARPAGRAGRCGQHCQKAQHHDAVSTAQKRLSTMKRVVRKPTRRSFSS